MTKANMEPQGGTTLSFAGDGGLDTIVHVGKGPPRKSTETHQKIPHSKPPAYVPRALFG